MKIRSLSVRRMPGFEQSGFDLDQFSDGLNLVIGPNASGKTTACRAIRGLLWPESLHGLSPVSLLGQWDDHGQVLRLEVEGTRLRCQRDGVEAEAPPLPGPQLASCFTITIDDLFAGTETDEGLAEQVAREMAGGYDLGAIRQLDQFRLRRGHGRKELDDLQKAKQQVKAIQAEQEKLRGEEDELSNLEKQEIKDRNAQARLARLEDVRQLIEVRSKIAQTQDILNTFPPEMKLLRGDENKRLEEIQTDLDQNIRDLQQQTAAAEKAKTEIAETNLPPEGIPQVRLNEQNARLEKLNDTERELRDQQKRLREAEQRAEAALRGLSDAGTPEKLDNIDLAALDDIEDFHHAAEDVRSKQSALRARLELLGPEKPPGDITSMTEGLHVLRQWFEAPPGGRGSSRAGAPSLILVWLMAALLALLGIVLGANTSPWWLLLLLPAAAAVLATRWTSRLPQHDFRRVLQQQFGRLPLEPPPSWDCDTVGKYVNNLERNLANARQVEARENERRSLHQHLKQLDEEAAKLDCRRAELIERFGVALDTSNLTLSMLATKLRTYQEASTICRISQGEVAKLQHSRNQQLKAVNDFLAEFGQEPCDCHEVARASYAAIVERANKHREAKLQLTAAEENIASAKSRITTLEERKKRLFTRAGLDAGLDQDNDAKLADRLEKLAQYRETVKKLNTLLLEQASLERRLEDTPELRDLDIRQVETEASRLEARTKSWKGLVEKIADIRSRVDRAGRETRLQEALAQVEQAADALIECRDQAVAAAAGNFLLDEVEDEHEVESRPEVFRQAVTWFGRFTRGRYELRIAEAAQGGSPAFRALETSSGRGLGLDELSRGTRMQLLLAVRLAFAADAERGTTLPLVLDEVLSSSDPVRFRAIIECLLALVQHGRQVFYFTCQPGDAAAWQQVAEEMGIAGARRLELPDVQHLRPARSAPLGEPTIQVQRVPEPGNMTLPEYADLLGVPELDPAAGARAAHVAHLVENAAQLYRLLEASIETCGQLRSLTSHGNVDAYVPTDVLDRIEAKAVVLDAFAEAWGIGRGRPLSREVLLAAGISDSYIDRVSDLARDLDWDPKRLVAALDAREDQRARGFRRNSLQSLAEALNESGHLDDRETLEQQEVLTWVLAAANEVVKRGAIDAAEVQDQCARLWQKCAAADP